MNKPDRTPAPAPVADYVVLVMLRCTKTEAAAVAVNINEELYSNSGYQTTFVTTPTKLKERYTRVGK